jgi:hypothetical protein
MDRDPTRDRGRARPPEKRSRSRSGERDRVKLIFRIKYLNT